MCRQKVDLYGGRAEIHARIDEVYRMVCSLVCSGKIKYGRRELEDVVQEGVLGVLSRAHRYDPGKSSLSTFVYMAATQWLWQQITQLGNADCRRINDQLLSLNLPIVHGRVAGHGDRNTTELIDLIPSDEDMENSVLHDMEMAELHRMIDEIKDDRARYVTRARFVDGRTLDEIGADVGISRERVRQIAMKEIRRISLRARRLRRGLEGGEADGSGCAE